MSVVSYLVDVPTLFEKLLRSPDDVRKKPIRRKLEAGVHQHVLPDSVARIDVWIYSCHVADWAVLSQEVVRINVVAHVERIVRRIRKWHSVHR